jgi:penicillin-insensitive murein endopeptidase
MTTRRNIWLGGIVAIAVGACATVVGTRSDEAPTSNDRTIVETPPPAPPMPEAPPDAPETWTLPAWAMTDPSFPFLPDDDRTVSRSIGGTTHGWLVNATRIARPHPHLAVLDVQNERDHDYTTDQMLGLVESAAAHVAERHPGSVLYLGNFSADGGGDIPQSVSHNNGRDADLAFFLVDEEGEAVVTDDLVPLDDDGKFVSEDGEVYRFDVPRNWALIEGLVEHGRGRIQYVFVSDALRDMLLDYAREQGADRSVVRHAGIILHQPGGALPHNDHFHVRVYCSEVDVASGCVDRGRKVPGYERHAAARRDAAKRARGFLDHAEDDVRLAAVRRLQLLDDRGSAEAIAGRLSDESPAVRVAATRTLAQLGKGERAIADQLSREADPHVRGEMVWALGDFGSPFAVKKLTALLDDARELELAGDELDQRVLVSDVLAVAEDPRPVPALIGLTRDEDPRVRRRAHRALQMLTNHDPAPEEGGLAAAWKAWHERHGNESRDQWLAAGFRAHGFEVPRLAVRHVWELCKAVLEADYLSYNAQRVLMRLSRRTPASLSWPKTDANFYWRRWFERRCGRLGCPPVPDGMSTLD